MSASPPPLVPEIEVEGRLARNLILFGRLCRRLGLSLSPDHMAQAVQALGWIDLRRRREVFGALRCLWVTRASQLAVFEKAFDLFWRERHRSWSDLDLRSLGEGGRKGIRLLPPSSDSDQPEGDGQEHESKDWMALPLPSRLERLRKKDFARMSSDELQAARRLMERLDLRPAVRATRRRRPGKGSRLDLRRTLRMSFRSGGEVLRLDRLKPLAKPLPLVLICDISGSMAAYTRVFLHFMHALSRLEAARRIESFVFATRLTRITLPLRCRSVDRALSEVGEEVQDWGGGTRIGEALDEFNRKWSRRVLGRGAVVLLITDAWDRGEAGLLERESARLSRSCRRLIWLNPLLGHAGYQPLTRGARLLLPHCDELLPIHNLQSLQHLTHVLGGLGHRLRRGRSLRPSPVPAALEKGEATF